MYSIKLTKEDMELIRDMIEDKQLVLKFDLISQGEMDYLRKELEEKEKINSDISIQYVRLEKLIKKFDKYI